MKAPPKVSRPALRPSRKSSAPSESVIVAAAASATGPSASEFALLPQRAALVHIS